MIHLFKKGFKGFVRLFYPRVCAGCGENLLVGEDLICLNCHQNLVSTNYGRVKTNPFYKNMSARIPIKEASAMYYFTKGGIIQNILHEIKYKRNSRLAIYMGRMFGKKMLEDNSFQNIDLIIPVPLHSKKERKRGFNQCSLIIQGITEITQQTNAYNVLERVNYTSTQTHKTRTERWENVKDSFRVKNIESIKGKHILLLDDVMTTGATLEACARTLIEAEENVSVSLATLVYTDEL